MTSFLNCFVPFVMGLANEAKTDEKNLKRAQKEVAKAEKAYQKGMKETQKAKKKLDKISKTTQKTLKSLESAQHSHNDAASKMDKAERNAKDARDKESSLEQEVGNYQDCLTNVHQSKIMNDDERGRRKAAAYIKTRQDEISREAREADTQAPSSPVVPAQPQPDVV
ncbi:hypothetical protein BXZ70DRAFT_1004589 [Cristinia sonorae]|uniref:Uncharacterized protein n=1 Tax=Cristinia sonorae TaxID=1940300 RepID=A0A8K0XTV1_9AGAR|nr:hypothetical protein BXZ70DRAFT_1004589 [Cristinia sonorae]